MTKRLTDAPGIQILKVATIASTFLGLHFSIAFGWALVPIIAIVAATLVALAYTLRHDRGRLTNSVLIAVLCLFGGVLGLHLGGFTVVDRALTFPSILILAGVSVVFGRSLLNGQEPIVNRFMRIELGKVPEPAAKYGRRLTVIWAGLLAAMAAESLVLAIFADLGTWSWLVNVVNPAILIAFFIGQHMLGRRYLPERRHASPLSTFRVMLQPSIWFRSTGGTT